MFVNLIGEYEILENAEIEKVAPLFCACFMANPSDTTILFE